MKLTLDFRQVSFTQSGTIQFCQIITFFNHNLCIFMAKQYTVYYGRGIVGNIAQTSAKNKTFSHQLAHRWERAYPIVGRG